MTTFPRIEKNSHKNDQAVVQKQLFVVLYLLYIASFHKIKAFPMSTPFSKTLRINNILFDYI